MVNLQKSILKKYLEVHNAPPLRFIAEDTSLGMSRIHRLFNGHEMRISEYQQFLSSIDRKNKLKPSGISSKKNDLLQQLIQKCDLHLSSKDMVEIANLIHRKIRYSNLKKMEKNITHNNEDLNYV